MFKSRAPFASCLALAIGGCEDSSPPANSSILDASAASVAAPQMVERDFSEFDRLLRRAIEDHNRENPSEPVEGASAVVVEREQGIVHSKGYGSYAENRTYLLGSASTILSVGILMRLADEGVLDLDVPISRYLPSWGIHKPNVTLAQLLSNSSGLPASAEIASPRPNGAYDDPTYLPHRCQYREAGTLSDCGRAIYLDDAPVSNRPADVAFRYGGSQWQLAGAIAEQVSGRSWIELVAETYLAPCQVLSLGYTNQFEKSPHDYPSFFDGRPETLPQTANPSIEGGGFATAQDIGKLLLMHLRGGKCGIVQVLSESAVARMQKDRVGGQAGYAPDAGTGDTVLHGYGLGWWVNDAQGYVAVPGLYGAQARLDPSRGYAAFIAIEASAEVGAKLAEATMPVLERLYAPKTAL
ncbi:MAG: serine hydrolase domain-containing protein [Polyangiales bacterium]